MKISDEVRTVVESGRLAHLTTLNPDGSPQMSLVRVGIEDDEIVTAHLGAWRKVRNVWRDPRVALTMEADGTDGGLGNYLMVHGTARVTEGGAPTLLNELAQRYIGPGTVYPPPTPEPPQGYITRITVDRVGGVGPWTPQTTA